MPTQEISERLRKILEERIHVDPKLIPTGSAALDVSLEDLGFDSLDRLDTIMVVEDEFGIEVSDEITVGIKTFGDLVRAVEALTGARMQVTPEVVP